MIDRFGLYETENPSILQVKVPVPYPLKWVNAYLIRGKAGFTVVDPGIRTEEAIALWEQVWEELGSGYGDVEQIVLTHHHPDHYGLAGWFQERTGGAPVLVSARAEAQARDMWGEDRSMTENLLKTFLRHGFPTTMLEAMQEHMESFVPLVTPRPSVTFVAPGERVRLGDDFYEAVETAGHAYGHLSFYREETGEMLCGDHVLPRISPNVSYLPGVDEHPLASYLETLKSISNYRVTRAYPGHREPFTTFEERCQELVKHHENRLQDMWSKVAEAGDAGLSAYELCQQQFGGRLTVHQMRFALSETIAHLIHLEDEGRVKHSVQADLVRYHV